MPKPGQRLKVRLAELVALLSLGTDLGLGQPMEHMIRACLIALRLADLIHLEESQREILYYSGLLAWVGCHTDAYEQAKWLGDDTVLKQDAHYNYDFGRTGPATAFMLKHLGGQGRSALERARVSVGFLGEGRRAMESLANNHYLATDELATRLGLSADIRQSLRQSYERWDGKGAYGLSGDEAVITSRLMNLADVVEVAGRAGGIRAAMDVAHERSGGQFDPALVEAFCAAAPSIFEELDSAASWEAIIGAEPALARELDGDDVDEALAAIGSFAELKSPWTMGHAEGVAQLAARASAEIGLPEDERRTLRRAAWLQDIGRLGIANTIWDKRGPLTLAEMERVRLHPYLSERMLLFSEALAPLAATAVLHHERLDGSGYPHGLSGSALSTAGRLLAAADTYQALITTRPHRLALGPDAAAATVRAEVAAGRLDGEAVDSVLRAAGHRVRRQREWPAKLTAREVEVLRLVAYGLSNAEIARQLMISRKTAGSHVEHVYAKIAASNRAQAALFAMKHGLMTGFEPLRSDWSTRPKDQANAR